MVEKRDSDKAGSNLFQQLKSDSALPELYSAERIPSLFEDSTHQLWRCETADGDMILKRCHRTTVEQSPIWQMMHQLFDVSLPDDLAHFHAIQAMLEKQGVLPIPELIACGGEADDSAAFVLSRVVEGEAIQKKHLTDDLVIQFARQIATLHLKQQTTWGKLFQADKVAEDWPAMLLKTLLRHSRKLRIGEPWLYKVMTQLEQVTPRYFVPIMLDNRWDQYLINDNKITALVDLDAFVIGPPELELVLLEYQLDQKQADVFVQEYQKYLAFPDIASYRLSYRLLLFLMNALGESNLDRWMTSPHRW